MIFYHGTTIDIKDEELKPNRAFLSYQDYKTPAVFLTINKIYALLHSRNPIRIFAQNNNLIGRANAFSSYFEVKNNRVILYECYDNMLQEVYSGPAYLYTCDININEKNNIDLNNYRYEGSIKYKEKIFIENVLELLQSLEKENLIEIKYYNTLSEFEKDNLIEHLNSRANSCESEVEILYFKEKFKDVSYIQSGIKLRPHKNK